MAQFETIDFSLSDGVARITLNRPDRLNSFTKAMHAELAQALDGAAKARVIVLTGAGRGFCAGQDLNDRAVAPGEAVDLGETVEASWNPLIRRLATMPQPVIARVNGVAAGAGANIALACDIVVAAKPRLVGQQRALGLALTGEPLMAEKAAEWGMIWKCVDDDALDAEADALAAKLAALPPLGLAAIKSIIRTSGERTLDQELDLQRDEMRRLGFTADYREGVAAFLEKRKATFTGT